MAECVVLDSNGCTGEIAVNGISGLDALEITVTLVSFVSWVDCVFTYTCSLA